MEKSCKEVTIANCDRELNENVAIGEIVLSKRF